MSSPFTFSSHIPGQAASSSSPFPISTFPYPSPNFPAPSPLSNLLPGNIQSPAINFGLPGTSFIAGTPQTLGSVVPPGPGTAYGGNVRAATGSVSAGSEVSLDSILRSVEDVLRMLERLESTIGAMIVEQQAVFEQKGTERGGQEGDDTVMGDTTASAGSPGRIMALQQEYAQTLLLLHPLLTSSLLGALPVPLSAASTSSTTPSSIPSMADLTAWAERQAELDFSRREGVKAGAKAILDTLRARAG